MDQDAVDPSDTVRAAPNARAIGAYALATPVIAAVPALVVAIGAAAIAAVFLDDGSSDEGAALLLMLIFLASWVVAGLIMSLVVGRWLSGRLSLGSGAYGGGRQDRTSLGTGVSGDESTGDTAVRTGSDARGVGRTGLALVFAGWLPTAAVAGIAMAWFLDRAGLALLGGWTFGAVVAAAVLAAVARGELRPLVVPAAVGATLILGGVVLEDGHRLRGYDGAPPPATGVVDTAELGRVLPGWTVMGYRDVPGTSWRPPMAEATVRSDGGATLTVLFHSDPDACPVTTSCEALEPLADGSAVHVAAPTSRCNGQPADMLVSVARPRGHWSVYSSSRCQATENPTADDLRALMSTIEPLDLEAWVEAT